ncbi:VOC family protein [Terrimonas pollutisoli]|uniref:VOC family protein n=1 Tax=Terrimonas pollutisoli TaxID=3034147 RepID=UPI0023EC2BEB|nr:VOC family protein [Terrimonas sp. H1YJ31]
MTECVPFLKVPDIGQTIKWYQDIGFECTATNHIWEPGCELNWARLEWNGAAFMIGPDERTTSSAAKDSSLWFNVDEVDTIIEILSRKGTSMQIEPETFYGRKVVSFKDINAFDISFSCALPKKVNRVV